MDESNRLVYNLILEQVSEIFYSVKTEEDTLRGSVEFVSAQVEPLLGYRSHDFRDDPTLWFSIIHPDDAKKLSNITAQMVKMKRPVTCVYRIRHKTSGEYLWLEDRISPRLDDTGNFTGFYGFARDITERRLAEEALRESEQRWQSLVANIEERHFIYTHNVDGIFTYISPSISRILGYSPEEFCTHYTRYLTDNPANKEVVHHTNLSIQGIRQPPYEIEIYHKDGSIKWLEVAEVPVRDDQERVISVQGIAHEITERKRAEEELRQHRQHLEELVGARTSALRQAQDLCQIVVDSSPDWIFVKDLQHRFLLVNRAFAAAQNLTPKDMIGQCDTEFWSEELCLGNPAKGLRGFHEDDREAFAGRLVHNPNDVATLADGSLRIFDTYKGPLMDPSGEVYGVLCYCRDITEHKQAEDKLLESEERFRLLAETIDEVFWMADSPIEKMFYISPAYERVWQRSCASLYDNPRSFSEGIHPDDLDRVLSNLRLNQPFGQSFEQEYRVVRPDGTIRWVWDRGFPVRDKSGRVTRYVGIAQDITDRRQAEEALHMLNLELEERVKQRTVELSRTNEELRLEISERMKAEDALRKYEHIASASRDHMSFVGRDYIYQAVNDTYLKAHNRKREEIVGHSVPEILGQEMFERLVKERFDKCLAGNEVHYEAWFDLAGAGRRYLDVAYYPFFDKKGSVTGVVVGSRDITERREAEGERRRLEEQMRHAQKLESLGVMAGGIAHDFNNILMAVLGHAELAMMHLPAGSSIREDIEAIVKAAVRAADLSKQMLAYSGKGRFVVRALDLGEAIREITSMLSVSISKKVQLHFNLAPDMPAINADVSQLHQIIMNLVINASDAIGDATGTITVSTGSMHCDRAFLSQTWLDENLPEGLYVYLEVADTGCGMDKETLSRIFDPFFTTKFAGRGLGLAAVLGIIRSHRGALKIWSEPGKGTRFTIFFPVAPKPAQAVGREESPAHELAGRGTVMLVDDEDSVREVAGRLLENMGLKVLKASNGREALEIFRTQQENISCILLDLTMPEMDGEETFHELKKIREDVRVILSSGYTSEDVLQRFMENGLAGFIEKPYTLDALTSNICRVLDAGAGRKDSDIGKTTEN